MGPGVILIVTDGPDRSRALITAVERVADCHVVVTTQPVWPTEPVLGFIVDVTLGRPGTRAFLTRLARRMEAERPPSVFLTRDTSSATLREARSYGAHACLSVYTEARAVAAALIRQIDPHATVVELLVQRGVAQTGRVLDAMFRNAEAGSVDLAAIEVALDPVLNAIHEGGLARWLDLVWEHDDTTFQHCLIVAGLTAAFSQSLGFVKPDQFVMARSALVHDVGKAQIPAWILNKPGMLDTDEMAVMRTHAALGHDILKASGNCDPVALAVTRHHHEMLDGSGYPDGLSGPALGDPVRLLTICDIYAALIERRPYKPSLPTHEALRILNGMEGKIEAGLVQAFAKAVTRLTFASVSA